MGYYETGRVHQTLDSALLRHHSDFSISLQFQKLIMAVHYMEGDFESLDEATMSYSVDNNFSPQYRLILEALAHRGSPEELLSHDSLHFNRSPNQLVNDECYFIEEQYSRDPVVDKDYVQSVRKCLSGRMPEGSVFMEDLETYLPCALAFYRVMANTTDVTEHAGKLVA